MESDGVWGSVKVKDIAEINELTVNSRYPYNEILYIDTSSVTEGRINNVQSLKLDSAPSRAKRIVRHNDILISTVRPNLKHFGIIKHPRPNTIASTGFAVITTKKESADYLYRLLTTNWYTEFLSGIAESQQSNYPAFNPALIENTEISLPPLPIQEKIAAVLSAYDDLIENNNQRIAILEKMAEEIYREWFVRMRFPDHEKVKIHKGVPEGWEAIKVGNAFQFTGGGTPSTEENRYWQDGGVNWYTPSDITAGNGLFLFESKTKCTEEGLRNSSAKLFQPYSIMMTSRATIGAIAINTTEACTNQGFITCLPNERYPLLFLYFWLKLNKPNFEILSSGATFLELIKSVFKKIEILTPPKEVVTQFETKTRPLFDKIERTLRSSKILKKSRDLLLSRLITGKLSVEDLDIHFPPSMKEADA